MIKQTGDMGGLSHSGAAEPASGAMISLQLTPAIATAVDEWAAQHQISRADAVSRLIEIGLDATLPAPTPRPRRTARAIELAASQINPLIDPEAPSEERHRRIDRLTMGPPEFVDARVDLPKPKA